MKPRTLRMFRPIAQPLSLLSLEDRVVPSTVYALAGGNTLLRFDSATPGDITNLGTIQGVQAGETIVDIDFRPRTGQLIGVAVETGSTDNSVVSTYAINVTNAQATLIGTSITLAGAGEVATAFDFNPTVDRMRFMNESLENARFNPNNGALAADDPNINPGTSKLIAAAYDRNFNRQILPDNTVVPTTLYAINRADSTLAIVGGINGDPSPNGGAVTEIGSLGFTLAAAADGGFDISTTMNLAALTDAADDLTRLYTIDVNTGTATAVGLIGDGTTQILGLSILPGSVMATGAGPGGGPHVRTFDAITGKQLTSFFAYDSAFRGGVNIAMGDFTGDGIADVVVAAGPGGGPHVRIFNAITGAQIPGPLGSFFAYDPDFRGGADVAAGDVNGDGIADLITAPGPGGGPHVRVFDGATGAEIRGFFAFDEFFRGGISAAAGDVNGDGRADLIIGRGAGGAPDVRVFSGDDNAEVLAFQAYSADFLGGVFVAAGDFTQNGRAEIVTGAGAGGGPHVKVFNGTDASTLRSFFAFAPLFTGGARVAAADLNADGRLDILAGTGAGIPALVNGFDYEGVTALESFQPYGNFLGGVYVGGSRS